MASTFCGPTPKLDPKCRVTYAFAPALVEAGAWQPRAQGTIPNEQASGGNTDGP